MKLNKYIFYISTFIVSVISIGYASWQFNGKTESFDEKFLNITNNWKFNISMKEDGKVYDESGQIGHVTYEEENDLNGGSITSDFIFVDNNEAQVGNVVAYQLGGNVNLFSATEVNWYLPKSIVYEDTGEEIPVVGVDHLGTYTTIGGPLYRRFISVYIPEGYTFIGNYAFYLYGSDHVDACTEFIIPHSVEYIGHEAFNFSTLNHQKNMWDQKYKFRVTYEGTAQEFVDLIKRSEETYNEKYKGYKKDEMEAKARDFQKEVDDTGGIIYSGSSEYSWFFRPRGQEKNYLNSSYWPAQYDYIDVYCKDDKKVRYYANSPIADECKENIKHYKEVDNTYIAPQILDID